MTAINPLLLLLEEQALRIDALEDHVHDLKLALRLDKTANVQAAFGISESLAQLLILLADGKPRTKDQLHAGLFFRRPENSQPDSKLIDTIICKLRKCMGQYGVEIATRWSSGYQIVAGLEVVRSAIEHAEPYGDAEAARLCRLERDRLRQRLIRAAQGRVDRAHSISRQKPWEAAGVSRATWYRRAAKLANPEAYEAQLDSRRAWSKANREIEVARAAKDREKYRDKRNASKRRYSKQRRSSDPCFKITTTLRSRLNTALKANSKKGSAVKLLGCTIPQFKERLEGMWLDGMTWENHGRWHIDHIKPLATFDLLDPEKLAEACHYTNLQPLWALDNLRKGKRRGTTSPVAANDDLRRETILSQANDDTIVSHQILDSQAAA